MRKESEEGGKEKEKAGGREVREGRRVGEGREGEEGRNHPQETMQTIKNNLLDKHK